MNRLKDDENKKCNKVILKEKIINKMIHAKVKA